MERVTKEFIDVEHHGDVQQIYDEITKHGGKIVELLAFDHEEETATILFEVEDKELFKKAVKDDEDLFFMHQ